MGISRKDAKEQRGWRTLAAKGHKGRKEAESFPCVFALLREPSATSTNKNHNLRTSIQVSLVFFETGVTARRR